jgi:hypothetical protein
MFLISLAHQDYATCRRRETALWLARAVGVWWKERRNIVAPDVNLRALGVLNLAAVTRRLAFRYHYDNPSVAATDRDPANPHSSFSSAHHRASRA